MNTKPVKGEVIYLSGPMTGYANFNYPKFVRIAKALRAKGHIVLNPATQIKPMTDEGKYITIKELHRRMETGEVSQAESWKWFLRGDIIAVVKKCNAIYLLKNHRNSRGARFERSVAKRLKFKEYEEGKENDLLKS